MAWSDVLNQVTAVRMLRGALASDRVAHAYLFHGPPGVGKRALAIEFARALQCIRGEDEACGACKPCDKVRRLIHPDVRIMLPLPSDATPDDVVAWNRTIVEQPYTTIDYTYRSSKTASKASSNKLPFFHIARIQNELRPLVSLPPVEGRFKVIIMTDSDRLRLEATNAFLKLLEEPTKQTVFILTTSRQDLLLPTIVSRCQRVGFATLPAKVIASALTKNEGIPAEEAHALSRMADGSHSRALELAQSEDLMEDRKFVLQFMRISAVQSTLKQAALIDTLTGFGRERVKRILRLALSWIRDLILKSTHGAPVDIVNVDQAETVTKFVLNLPKADIRAMVELVEEALLLVEHTTNLKLVLTSLSLELGNAMQARHHGRLYVPLTGGPAANVVRSIAYASTTSQSR